MGIMEITAMGNIWYRIWGIRGSYINILKAIFYLLKGTIGFRGLGWVLPPLSNSWIMNIVWL